LLRDVHPDRGGHLDQLGAQRAVGVLVRVGRIRGDHQFQAGDRVVGHPADRVDVRPDRGERAGHLAEGPCGDRLPEHHDDVAGRPADLLPVGLDGGAHRHRDAGHGLLDGLLQPLRVAVGGDQRAQRELAPDHHLLHVQEFDAVADQRGEQH
jgi:hypothetical protein